MSERAESLERLQQAVDRLEAALAAQQAAPAVSDKELTALRAEADALRGKNAALMTALTDLEARCARMEQRNKDLAGQVGKVIDSVSSVLENA